MEKSQILDELLLLEKVIYSPLNLPITQLSVEEESQEYHACTFKLNSSKVIYRKAKITPTKIGQFVTLWKRISDGPIQPFSEADEFDLVIINVNTGTKSGQFVFTKSILLEKGIISNSKREGKRGFRAYPPWDKPESKQALNTQNWQSNFFLRLNQDSLPDIKKAKRLHLLGSDGR